MPRKTPVIERHGPGAMTPDGWAVALRRIAEGYSLADAAREAIPRLTSSVYTEADARNTIVTYAKRQPDRLLGLALAELDKAYQALGVAQRNCRHAIDAVRELE